MFLAGARANPEALAIIFQIWHRRPQSASIVLPEQHTLQQLAAQLSMYMCDLSQWGKVAEILGRMPSDTALWILSAADPQWTAKVLAHIKSKTVRENLRHVCVAAGQKQFAAVIFAKIDGRAEGTLPTAKKESGAADALPLTKIEAKSAPKAEKKSGAADVLPLQKIEDKSAPVVEKRSANLSKISKRAQRPPDAQFRNFNGLFLTIPAAQKVGGLPKWRRHCHSHAIPRGLPKNSVP
jgi:hypothetical protein